MTPIDSDVPRFLYGTAWKEETTKSLTELALRQGFRGIDTANQRRHYHEAAVGEGISAAIAGGIVTAEEIFLQTKFTFLDGQDHRLPYDPSAPIATQVAQSFASSLEHLRTERIDSYILHGPSRRFGLGAADWEAWRAMEEIQGTGRARRLGVSNVSVAQLASLCERATIAPSFVQNRCFAVLGWDKEVRAFCRERGIAYQGFSLLTANREALSQTEIHSIAERHHRSIAQIVFRFALDVGMIPLTGTTSADHMRQDLEVFNFQLSSAEVATIENIALE